jgi:hypothetical protein
MRTNKHVVIQILILSAIFFINCNTFAQGLSRRNSRSALSIFITQNRYEPFAIPRTDWGTGTVINIRRGGIEEIVALNNNCLELTPDSATCFIQSNSYELDASNSLELNLIKVIDKKIDLTNVFEKNRLRKVRITLRDCREDVLPTIRIEQRIRELLTDNNVDCINSINSTNNLLIIRTLSVGYLSYSFLDSNNLAIKLSVDFLNSIKLSDSLQKNYVGKNELFVNDNRVLIGYRVKRFKIKRGFTGTKIEGELLEPRNIQAIKQKMK